jgi:FkbM family methyltransferase
VTQQNADCATARATFRAKLAAVLNWAFIRQVGVAPWIYRTTVRQFTKRIGRDLQIRLPTGAVMTLPANSQFASEVYVTRARSDHGAEELFASLLRSEDDVLDVGANIGYYSLYMAPRVRTVYAFEPDARTHDALRANADRVANVTIVPLAVSDRVGPVAFDTTGPPEISHVTIHEGALIQATTIDAFVAETPSVRVGAIKVDAEGHDLAVLRGSEETIRRFAPLVLTECPASEDLFAFCEGHAYSVWAFAYPVGEPRRAKLTRMAPKSPLQTKMLFLVPPHLQDSFR